MEKQLSQLIENYRLSESWARPEVFAQSLDLSFVGSSTRIELIGLMSSRPDGTAVTASAGQLGSPPLDRAYFELIERTSVIESSPQAGVSDPNGKWRFSRSNGVATQVSWDLARGAATRELLERHIILKSWYGAGNPTRCPLESGLEFLNPLYDLEVWSFDQKQDLLSTVGIFGFPKDSKTPFVCGFGAAEKRSDAVRHASSEFLQRFGFLWGEELSSDAPSFSPTAEYHLEAFLRPDGVAKVRRWLLEGNLPGGALPPEFTQTPVFHFSELVPAHLGQKLSVVRAESPHCIPLIFGAGHPLLESFVRPELMIHPVS